MDFPNLKSKLVIGLGGFKRSGKDSVAKMLANDGFEILAFADAIREETNAILLPIHGAKNLAYWSQDEHKDEPMLLGGPGSIYPGNPSNLYSYRHWLIQIGQNRVKTHPHYWIHRVFEMMQYSSGTKFVISDVRMESEARAILSLSYENQIWWIDRQGCNAQESDVTESGVVKKYARRIIANNDSLEQLQSSIYDFA